MEGKMGIFDACLDTGTLIGRDIASLAADYDAAINDQPDMLQMVLSEHRAMEDLLLSRAGFLAPTAARGLAISLIPAGALLCATLDEVDAMLEATRDWIADMGDPARHARSVATLRAMGEDVPEARMLFALEGGGIVLDVYDETRIVAMLVLPHSPTVVIGVVDLDDEGEPQDGARIPQLAA